MEHHKIQHLNLAASKEQPHTFMDDWGKGTQEAFSLVVIAIWFYVCWRLMLRGARQVGRAWRGDRG